METLLQKKVTHTLILLLLSAGLLALLGHLSPLLKWVWNLAALVLTPFFISLIIAYLLNPVVNLLQRRKVPRGVAVMLIYFCFLILMALLVVNLVPVFSREWREILEQLPAWGIQLQRWIDQLYAQEGLLPTALQNSLDQAIWQAQEWLSTRMSYFFTHLSSTVEQVVILLTVPFVTYYLLRDFEVMERAVLAFVPKEQRLEVRRVVRDIDYALGNYIRGQLLVALCIGFLAYIGYSLIGLPYALLLAAFVALMDIIPYIGPYIGAIPALAIAFTVSPRMALWVVLVNVVVQFIEGNILSPPIVGRTVRLHPLTIIFSVLVGGKAAGLLGTLLAVPFVVVLKVILEHVISYRIRRKTPVPREEELHPDGV